MAHLDSNKVLGMSVNSEEDINAERAASHPTRVAPLNFAKTTDQSKFEFGRLAGEDENANALLPRRTRANSGSVVEGKVLTTSWFDTPAELEQHKMKVKSKIRQSQELSAETKEQLLQSIKELS
jgi:hypothetical protein